MKIAYAKIDFSKLEAWYLINMCARRNQIGNLIYLVFKAFDRSRTLANVKNKKQNGPVFLYMCATCSEIPSNVSTIVATSHSNAKLQNAKYIVIVYLYRIT